MRTWLQRTARALPSAALELIKALPGAKPLLAFWGKFQNTAPRTWTEVWPHEDWEDAYWAKMRESVPLGNLERFLDDEGRMLLETEIVGRDRELEEFRGFLQSPDRGKVLYHFGEPGCGKSRLAIEYGRIAQDAGWAVFFLRQDRPVDLDLWLPELHRETGADRVLVVWDDWQGQDEDKLRAFLALNRTTFVDKHGIEVCRVLTSWPEFRSAVRNLVKSSGSAPTLEIEVAPLSTTQESSRQVIDFVSDLFVGAKRPARDQLEEVVRLCEGYPMALLLGLDLVARGESLQGLIGRESIIHRRYSELIQDLDDNPNLPDPKTLDAYRRLAMVGELRESDLAEEGVDELIPGFKERRRDLLKRGYIRFDDATKSYRVEPDLLRRWVAQCSLRGGGEDLLRLEQPEQAWIDAARPFLPRWTAEIWAVTTLALEADDDLRDSIYEGLFTAIDESIRDRPPTNPRRRQMMTLSLADAGFARPESKIFLRFAESIARLNPTHEPASLVVDYENARTLLNATAFAETAAERRQIARQIEPIARRHDPPHPNIDLAWAKALFNATVPAETVDECLQIADQIETLARRHDPPQPDIDLECAKALFNTTVPAETVDERLQIADQIETLARRHDPPQPDIDLLWAEALKNATARAETVDERLQIANQIATLARRHDPPQPDIDLEWARALFNATVPAKTVDERLQIADQIETLARRHDPPQPNIDLEWAKALTNAANVAAESSLIADLATQLRELTERHPKAPEVFQQLDLVTSISWWKNLEEQGKRNTLVTERILPLVNALEDHPELLDQVRTWADANIENHPLPPAP